jgi:hypothetical protein
MCQSPERSLSFGSRSKRGCLLITLRIVPKRSWLNTGNAGLRNRITPALVALFLLPALAHAQFDFTTNNGTLTLTITGYSGPDGNVVIPASINGLPVTSIGNDAFNVSPGLTGVTIPSSVTSIGQGAFNNCSLTNVTIPVGVTNIGSFAFDCGSLTNITVDPLNSSFSSVGGVLFDKRQTSLIQYPGGLGGDYSVPHNVTRIEEGAFYNCFGLTNVLIPDNVTSIADLAFNGCTNLVGVTIGNSVISIEGATFSQCTSLTNIALGNNVVSIGDSAFYGCSSLASVTFPGSLTSFGQQAFALCYSLASVYFQGDAPSIGPLAFSSVPATVYYLPGTAGWDTTFAGLPTAPWTLPYSVILSRTSRFGLQTNQFGFTVSWATNLSVVVETSTDITGAVWFPLQTNSLASGSFNFSDPLWTNFPKRFYRIRSP